MLFQLWSLLLRVAKLENIPVYLVISIATESEL